MHPTFVRSVLVALALFGAAQVGCAATSEELDEGAEVGEPSISEDGLTAYTTPNEGFATYVNGKIGPLPASLSEAGKESALRRKKLHVQLIDEEGFGLYYGTEGTWRPKTDAPELKHPMAGSNCFAWALEVTSDAFRAAGKTSEWNAIHAIVKRDVRGTTFARALQDRGWTIVYWNPDVEHPVDGGAWKGNYTIAARHGGYYASYGGPKRVDDVIVNYAPNPLFPAEADTAAYDRLQKVPFYFGVAEGGMHTFVGSAGLVSEMHWTAEGTDKNAIEEIPLKDWYDDTAVAEGGRRTQWAEGLLVIPPGVWASTR